MKRREAEMICDLFMRMAEHVDNGMDHDTALARAWRELACDVFMVDETELNALRTRGITRH